MLPRSAGASGPQAAHADAGRQLRIVDRGPLHSAVGGLPLTLVDSAGHHLLGLRHTQPLLLQVSTETGPAALSVIHWFACLSASDIILTNCSRLPAVRSSFDSRADQNFCV